MSQLVFTAAEFLIDLFREVWATHRKTQKLPSGRRNYQVGSCIDKNAYTVEICVKCKLCDCGNRNFSTPQLLIKKAIY